MRESSGFSGRTPTQRRADALGDIWRFFLEKGNRASSVAYENRDVAGSVSCDSRHDIIKTSGGEKPHITVTIAHDPLAGGREGLAELGDAPVDPETIRRLACDASIVRMVLDADSMPIDVGRKTRTIPPALRRALEHRDQGCVWKGCTATEQARLLARILRILEAPVSWCDAHHLTHWAKGGETTLGNLVLLCRRHHTRIHKLHPQDNPRNYLRDTGNRTPEIPPPDT